MVWVLLVRYDRQKQLILNRHETVFFMIVSQAACCLYSLVIKVMVSRSRFLGYSTWSFGTSWFARRNMLATALIKRRLGLPHMLFWCSWSIGYLIDFIFYIAPRWRCPAVSSPVMYERSFCELLRVVWHCYIISISINNKLSWFWRKRLLNNYDLSPRTARANLPCTAN